MTLAERIAHAIKGDVAHDRATLATHSRDTSIFQRTPSLVVFPKDWRDVATAVKLVREAKEAGEDVSITARSAGTDMTGGPLTTSVSIVFTKYMRHMVGMSTDSATAEPGMYYRDFEKETLKKTGKLLPSYPASREYCAIGGMVSNDSGGELTLKYGKTHRYVRELEAVLSDGSLARFGPVPLQALEEKKRGETLEAKVYRDIHSLIERNKQAIAAARPTVSKNSAGYALWRVIDEERQTFDLSQLLTGSQGTLALVTNATLGLVELEKHRAMLVVFLSDLSLLPDIVQRVLTFNPESFESYDDHTFKLAVRFIPQIIRHFGVAQMFRLALAFVPEMWSVLTGGVPKLVLMAEFAEDSPQAALDKARDARAMLRNLHVRTKLARSETQAAKYWTIRRESFALLRKNLKGLYAAPFIDDIVVHPKDYPSFLPELNAILDQHHLLYTIAGHIGDGNFHIIPLMDMTRPAKRHEITLLLPKVYALVAQYKGSITGEHNDGIVRTPYLHLMFGDEMVRLFAEVKRIFDPLNIFNPGKKVGGTIEDIERDMITHA